MGQVSAGQQDLARAGQLAHVQALLPVHAQLPGQRVPGRHHGDHGFLAHLLEILAAVDGRALEDQGQMRAARMQFLERIDLGGHQHFHLQTREFLDQRLQRRGPGRGQQFGRDHQGQPLLQSLVQGQRLVVELLQLGGQQPGLGFECACRRRGPGLAAAAVEQLQVQLGLQLGDGHAHGRGHAAQLARGGGKRAVVQHGNEQRHLVGWKGHGGDLSDLLKESDFNVQLSAYRLRSL